jgi:hypothetical protein
MIGDAIAVIGLLKDWLQWTELEPLQVDNKWLDIAKEKNVVPTDRAYRWSDKDKVETRRLEDTYEIVWLIDKVKRTKKRVMQGNDLVLMAKK